MPEPTRSTGWSSCSGSCGKDPGLKEKSRGTFYCDSRAFLHFHEHGAEFFADVRLNDDFERFPAATAADRSALLARIDAALKKF
ncbi:MAG TPA: hypothetical protein VGM17_14625 [Rhizomicrobium sp.]|jgi:hypothetical protein